LIFLSFFRLFICFFLSFFHSFILLFCSSFLPFFLSFRFERNYGNLWCSA
jgi:hypothetical protein